MEFAEYVNTFDRCMSKYIPDRSTWSLPEEAVYRPLDFFRVPRDEADRLLFRAVKFQFTRHFHHNRMFHRLCTEYDMQPDALRTVDDLNKIPLIKSEFFKDHPRGKDFALWLANVFTGDLPEIHIKGKHPSYDEVVGAFNKSGMATYYSSGTGGRHTFTPRDMRSFAMNEFSIAKGAISMVFPTWNPRMRGFLMFPNPFKTNLFAGKVGQVFYDIMSTVEVAIDRPIDTELIRMTMAKEKGLKAWLYKSTSNRIYKRAVNSIIQWLDRNQKEKNDICMVGAPYILHSVLTEMKEKGIAFNFDQKGMILTGGGWKVHEQRRLPESEFRKEVNELLGIAPEHCLDTYGMVEGNGWATTCPEGHYLHVPNTYIHPMVLDDDYKQIGYGEYGRFAFLDGSMYAYPGFIITGDRVRMLEHCPHCDRPGPVFEPGVTRISGKDTRGCSEEMRAMISRDARGLR